MNNEHQFDEKKHAVFLERREKYAADFDKTVKPYLDVSLKMIENGRE